MSNKAKLLTAVVLKERAALNCGCPPRGPRQLVLKTLELSNGFQEKVLRHGEGEESWVSQGRTGVSGVQCDPCWQKTFVKLPTYLLRAQALCLLAFIMSLKTVGIKQGKIATDLWK